MRKMVRDRSCVDWEQIAFKKQQIWEPATHKSLLKRFKQNPEIFKAYDQLIKDQLVNNMIEKFSENQSENPKEFFLPYRPVTRQSQQNWE